MSGRVPDAVGPPAAAARPGAEAALLARLRARDETAFRDVVRAWSPVMLRLARSHVSTEASAQEVVQDTWLAVLRGLDGFEGRSTLRTWALRILVNTAKSRGVRESRVVPFDVPEDDGPAVDPGRFQRSPSQWTRHWTQEGAPQPWRTDPSQGVVRQEVRLLLEDALATLPPRQRDVVVLRDVHGLDAAEVCEVLELTVDNQRVLLHRGRSRVRALLEGYYRQTDAP